MPEQSSASIGILLVNLGTPDAPTTSAVRRYLKQFLWDPRVVEIPRLPWWLILNGIILNTRPKKSAAKYQQIWTEQGSPLLVISQQIATSLQHQLGERFAVRLGMRYGNPSVSAALDELRALGCLKLLVLPLFPQYSATTTASVFDAVSDELQGWRSLPELRMIASYELETSYIQALAESVRSFWQSHGRAQKLVMSFHGLPQEYADKGDPYPQQCGQTARALAATLQLKDDEWMLCFQSRLGRKQWLQPYTEQSLRELAKQGVQSVQMICPGFAADCLETLEEIAEDNRDVFLESGGHEYRYIPCLNDNPAHIAMFAGLVHRHCQGWI